VCYRIRPKIGGTLTSLLLSVAALVLEAGNEDEVIAALLHDAVEDQGGIPRNQIRQRFGDRVVAIVDGCTEFDTLPKPPWQEQTRYLENLRHASPAVRRVSLMNAAQCPVSIGRMAQGAIPSGLISVIRKVHYGSTRHLQVYRETGSDFMTEELGRVVLELCQNDNR